MSRYAPPTTRATKVLALIVPLLGTVTMGTACTDGAPPTGSGSAAPSPTAVATSTNPSDQPSPTASARPTTIPTSAFFELPPELRKSPRQTTPVSNALPKLCANEFGTGGRQVTASAAMTVTYKKADEPPSNVPQGMIHQTIFTFDGDGASDYMQRVRSAVQACPTYKQGDNPVKVESRALPGAGDEALLLTRTWAETSLNGDRTGDTATSQIAVARVDGAVTVFNDQGWEGTSGNPAVLDQAVRDGVRTLDAWQR
ncbi:hypothetical protein ACWD6L_06625 [Micromonospora profundi]|uniref:Sensor domain-containing protein n=1 Tax=Micromonospora profundi TaxID=1420889 RepID=A0AAJ6HQE3_9ACTN|nr:MULTISPECIES: hypothetical protein [Micromonospora]KOX04770.1 hypothetical protein ADK66_25865 [Micromonospora sp. NRRL B-16802]WLS44312.1 hypothetical protein Q3V37_23350 [Micromonospora profundi]